MRVKLVLSSTRVLEGEVTAEAWADLTDTPGGWLEITQAGSGWPMLVNLAHVATVERAP